MNYFIKSNIDWLNHYEEVTKQELIMMLEQYHACKGELPPIKLDDIQNDNMYFVIDYEEEEKITVFLKNN